MGKSKLVFSYQPLGALYSRRQFVGLGLLSALSVMVRCMPVTKVIPVKLATPNYLFGHELRSQNTKLYSGEVVSKSYDVVVIGAGVSGLSAARFMIDNGVGNIKVVDLESKPGGNARSGIGKDTAFPLGAHYLPIPDPDLTQLVDFLHNIGVIVGFDDKGLPIYNDLYLCHEPEERLFINGYWQKGLVPSWGVPEFDQLQIKRFFLLMEGYTQARDADGKFAFALPTCNSSSSEKWQDLHVKSMESWLLELGFDSSYLKWYINYCCLDDYGAPASQVSAWAGIHYFASRRGRASNANADDVLTWPEGNSFLVHSLVGSARYIQLNTLVRSVSFHDNMIKLELLSDGNVDFWCAKKVIIAVPQFIAKYLLRGVKEYSARSQPQLLHYPWLVANLHLSQKIDEQRGEPLCWDNVIYGMSGLGYVHANHQHIGLADEQYVLTFYKPLTEGSQNDVRSRILNTPSTFWQKMIIDELMLAHPYLSEIIDKIDVWIWGHGIVAPTPGLLVNPDFHAISQPINDRIYFAHTDYTGFSLFEEAFYQGIRAAENCISDMDRDPSDLRIYCD